MLKLVLHNPSSVLQGLESEQSQLVYNIRKTHRGYIVSKSHFH